MEIQESVGDATSRRRPPRVLVVDDDPAIRLVCATTLSLDWYEVIEAANGQDALHLVLTQEPDVVLLDLSLPVLDGFCVAAALRANDRTKELPLVVITGETGPHTIQRVHEIGVAGLFMKPFDPGAVAAFVRDVISEVAASKRPAHAGGHSF